MDQERSLRLKEDIDELVIYEDETMFTTCPEIEVRLENDQHRKVTIISGSVNSPSSVHNNRIRTRSQSNDLRRRAILNNALQSERTSRSRSRNQSHNFNNDMVRSPNSEISDTSDDESSSSRAKPQRAILRSRSTARARDRTDQPSSRSCSRSRSRSLRRQIVPRRGRSIRRTNENRIRLPSQTPIEQLLRTPTELNDRTKLPESIQLPSPLFVLTEQQVTGVSKDQSVEFVTKILLTTKKLTMRERQALYSEMVKAESLGGSRSSTDVVEDSVEDFNSKIFYSDKGVYIETTQIARKVPSGRNSKVNEEKTYPNICKTRIIGGMGKFIDGYLNIKCAETIEAKNQVYTRSETFTIGLQTEKADGVYELNSEKKTFDPTKSIKFNERILFDRVNIGIVVNHSATADMTNYWDHEAGSFGEQNCEYREINFFFGAPTVSQIQGQSSTPARSQAASTTRSYYREKSVTRSDNAAALKDKENTTVLTNETRNFSNSVADASAADKSFFRTIPVATSTPRSEATTSAHSSSNTSSISTKRKRGAPSVRSKPQTRFSSSSIDSSASGTSENGANETGAEIDIDRSIKESSSRRASRNLSKKQKIADITNNNSTHNYSGGSASSYNSMNTATTKLTEQSQLTETKVKKSASSQKLALTAAQNTNVTNNDGSKISPASKGQLRIKETKITREVRESNGRPPQVKEKKEETFKIEDVPFGRSKTRTTSPYKINTSEQKASATDVTINEACKPFNISIDNRNTKSIDSSLIQVEHSTLIKVDSDADDKLQTFREVLTLETLINNKPHTINLNLNILAKQQPKISINRVKLSGVWLWEKSTEWNSISANTTTSNTKTLATQQSDISAKKSDTEKEEN